MKRLIGLAIILASIFIIPIHVFAVDYSIETMEINASLQENGDVDVTEVLTYDFEGKFNGITRTLIPKTDSSIQEVKATEHETPLDVEQEDHLYKIYRDGNNESVTIQLTYTIKDGVQVYADVAEFYWPFFDTSNESDYEQLDVYVHPPNPTDDVIAFGYHAAESTASIEKDGTAHFAMGQVASGTKGDIRVAYDNTLFPNVAITKNEQMRDHILAKKNKLERKQQKFESNQNKVGTIAPVVAGVFTIILGTLLVYAWRKKKLTNAEIDRLYPLPYFVPEEAMSLPATISYTNAGGIQAETLTAGLLDLVRKEYIKQLDDNTFIVHHQNTDYMHEQFLIDWLFYKVGDDGTFKLTDLKTYTDKKENHKTYYKDFTNWKKLLQKEVKQNRLTQKKLKLRLAIGLTSVIILPFSVLFIIYEFFGFMTVTFILFFALLTFAVAYQPRTLDGAKIKRDWMEFRKKYVDTNEEKWTELADDEQKRAFIYGIGINDKKLKDKNQSLLNSIPNTQQQHVQMSPLLFLLMAANANTHFNEANKVAAASTSGGAGAGGTGVGGGGGGSGAF